MNTLKNEQGVHKYKRLLRQKKGETFNFSLIPPFRQYDVLVAQLEYSEKSVP